MGEEMPSLLSFFRYSKLEPENNLYCRRECTRSSLLCSLGISNSLWEGNDSLSYNATKETTQRRFTETVYSLL